MLGGLVLVGKRDILIRCASSHILDAFHLSLVYRRVDLLLLLGRRAANASSSHVAEISVPARAYVNEHQIAAAYYLVRSKSCRGRHPLSRCHERNSHMSELPSLIVELVQDFGDNSVFSYSRSNGCKPLLSHSVCERSCFFDYLDFFASLCYSSVEEWPVTITNRDST